MMCERKECAEECLYQAAVVEVLLAPVTAQLSRPQVTLSAHQKDSHNSRVTRKASITYYCYYLVCFLSRLLTERLPARPQLRQVVR